MPYYAKISNIEGSVSTKGYENQIELASIDAGISRNINTRPGHTTDREYSTPKLSEFVVTKIMDKSSPYLFEASCTGQSIGEVIITATGSSAGSDKYLQYTLSDAIISNYNMNGVQVEGDEQHPSETLSFNYSKIEMTYIPRTKDNRPSSPISAGYDMTTASRI